MTIIKFVTIVLILVVGLVFFTLQRNEANLFQPPGFYKRLNTFLTVNTAETSDTHPFEELRTPVFSSDAEKLYQRVLYVAAALGWGILAHDSDKHNANFVVRSPVFLFEDDVYVQIIPVDDQYASLYIQSSSRSGRADFAANSGHIQELIRGIKE